MRYSWILALAPVAMWAQEASTGFELRTILSEEGVYSHVLTAAPRGGSPVAAGFRAMLYPSLKLNSHWTLAGAVQVHSRPYFYEELATQSAQADATWGKLEPALLSGGSAPQGSAGSGGR